MRIRPSPMFGHLIVNDIAGEVNIGKGRARGEVDIGDVSNDLPRQVKDLERDHGAIGSAPWLNARKEDVLKDLAKPGIIEQFYDEMLSRDAII